MYCNAMPIYPIDRSKVKPIDLVGAAFMILNEMTFVSSLVLVKEESLVSQLETSAIETNL